MLPRIAILALLFVAGFAHFCEVLGSERFFQTARPVWPIGLEEEKNLLVGFRAVVSSDSSQKVILKAAASSLYRFFVNGAFVGHGPARGPHGYYRVDEWDLSKHLISGKNLIAIEVAGYNINSYYLLNQPSFLQAEVVAGGKVVAFTSEAEDIPFEAILLKEKVQKSQRYSFQRTFTEMYELAPGFDDWRTRVTAKYDTIKTEAVGKKELLARGIPYPRFNLRHPLRHCGAGRITQGVEPEVIWKDRSLTQIDPTTGGFLEEDLVEVPTTTLQKIQSIPNQFKLKRWEVDDALQISQDSYRILDFGTNLTGFIGAKVTAHENSRLYLTFDELLTENDVDFKRLNCANFISFELSPGDYNLETIEPYTLRYLKAFVLRGTCSVRGAYLREYTNPDVWEASFAASDERLNRLFEAGRETYRQNAIDIFMDCPSRERAGWLCDSFFTSRVGIELSGDTKVEANFFQNYLLPPKFPALTDGMLPMCYPADHGNGRFIPNWALWFVLELEEYVQRSGDHAMLKAFRPRVTKLFGYFEDFENEDGLLEGLESWVFIEWSMANQFVQDVNYPSNMLYAAALDAAGRLYDRPAYRQKASQIREIIRKQSFDGQFFVDNAVREGNQLTVTRNRTEVNQYLAFYFNVANSESHPQLYKILREEFGPEQVSKGLHPEVHPANAFVGNVVRMELLSRWGLTQQLLDESVAYFLYMAKRTGTLWENITPEASCNHGFASHVVHLLYRDVLGLFGVEPESSRVHVRFPKLNIDWCEGRIPLSDGTVSLRWRSDSEHLFYRLEVPAGYKVSIENLSGLKLSAE